MKNPSEEPFFRLSVLRNAVDSLETAADFTARDDDLKWKWIAIALHHALYSFCIAALHNSNPDEVISRGRNEDNETWLKKENSDQWLKSKKVKINGGPAYRIEWKITEGDPPESDSDGSRGGRDRLIGFWTALARVQDPVHHMGKLTPTEAITITDEQIERVEFLVHQVRNEIIHFIPKGYLVDVEMTKDACRTAIDIIEDLVHESHSILKSEPKWRERTDRSIEPLHKIVST